MVPRRITADATARRVWLGRLVGAGTLALVGVTWPLWLPPTPESFPQLPLVAWLVPAPGWCDWLAVGLIVAGAMGLAVGERRGVSPPSGADDPHAPDASGGSRLAVRLLRLAPLTLLLGLALAMLLNQIRVQVWAYQFLLLAGVLAACPRTPAGDRAAVLLARVLACGVLFHSALSKLDLAFAEGPGAWLMGGFLSLFRADAAGVDPALVKAAAFAVPAWELALAVLLAVPSLRRVGLVGAGGMHLALVATLWNLDQSWGVLLWNLFFFLHELVLFWPEPRGERVPVWTAVRTAGVRAWPAAAVILLAGWVLPLGTRSGYWDVWPGWAVYAGGVPKARGYLHPGTTTHPLAERLSRAGLPRTPYSDSGVDLQHDERALEGLGVPVPQDLRVRAGLTLADLVRTDAANAAKAKRLEVGASWPSLTFRPAGPRTGPPAFNKSWTGTGIFRTAFRGRILNARPRALSLPATAR